MDKRRRTIPFFCWLSNKRSALIAIVLRRPRFLPSYLEVRAFYHPTHTLVLVTLSFIGYHKGVVAYERGNAFGTDTSSRKDSKMERGSRNTCAIKRGKARFRWTISAEDKYSLAILVFFKSFLIGVRHDGDFGCGTRADSAN